VARQRLAGRERARKIIEAAMGLFARRGFRGVTSREIAAAAGVSEALIFKHFPRKDSLYHAILEAKLEESASVAADDAALRLLGDEAYLAGVASDIMTRVDRDDTFLRLLLHSALEGHPLAGEFRRIRIDRVRERIARRIRLRYARRRWQAPVDPAVAARIFSGMILASLLHRHIFHDPQVSRVPIGKWSRTLARVFLKGLEPAEGRQ